MITKKCIFIMILQINAKSASFGTNCNLNKGEFVWPTGLSQPRFSNQVQSGCHWRLRSFFGRKSPLFLIYILKDPPHSCDHFHAKIMVVGWCVWAELREKLIKNCNKLQFDCDAINDVTLMSHTSSESPWSEVMLQWIFWGSDHVVAL